MHAIASTLCSLLSFTFCLAEVTAYNLHAPWGENLLTYGTREIQRENDIRYMPYIQYIRIYERTGAYIPSYGPDRPSLGVQSWVVPPRHSFSCRVGGVVRKKQRYKLFNLFSRRCRIALAILISDSERLASLV